MRIETLGVLVGTSLALLASVGRAAADPPTGADTALQVTAGKALLDEGLKLVREGRFEAAREKLEASVRNDPSPEGLLALGDCEERLGTTASAWGTFHKAQQQAGAMGDAGLVQEAARRGKALEARLSKVKVAVAASEVEPEVEIDGRWVVKKTLWGVALPLDPGMHALSAKAPGRPSYTKVFELASEGETQEVLVPELREPVPEPTARAPVEVPPMVPVSRVSTGNSRFKPKQLDQAGTGLLIAGGIGVTAAAIIGCIGIGCPSTTGGSSRPIDLSPGVVIGTLIGGLVVSPGMMVGGVFLLREASKRRGAAGPLPSFGVTPIVARNAAGLSIGGTF